MSTPRLRSLGLRTDLMLLGWDGVIDELDGGVVRARLPGNPSFFFGNFLLFPDAPAAGEAIAWTERFAGAFADDPRIHHVCLRWDRPDGARGALEDLEAAGFRLEEQVVLATHAPHAPPRVASDVTLRRIESDADWAAVTSLQVATMEEAWGSSGASGAFARAQMRRYRGFVDAGRGAWFGAFAGDELAADMGVFVDAASGLGRFQAVETAPRFRRRGVCGTLLVHAARAALEDLGAAQLVIVGLADHTSAIYASCGFEERERLWAAVRGH